MIGVIIVSVMFGFAWGVIVGVLSTKGEAND
jgi:ABC-type uncharacterized transport system permease subunit